MAERIRDSYDRATANRCAGQDEYDGPKPTDPDLHLRLPFDYFVIGYMRAQNGREFVAVRRDETGSAGECVTYAIEPIGNGTPRGCHWGHYGLDWYGALEDLTKRTLGR